ncbi:ATP-binding protein [Delftia sp. PE138]|uniref:PAS domain-containing hybrid sensor histidine kinase/response regulator n=1 Tax=Delftia sp. PE138 TaxID=1812483 RepID=UPI001BB07CBD|nr:ATP-binding protein [Delftia sp. PE138]MBS3723025.1 Sensor histidine kinase RcsC [Delftia sp. PE138]
MQPNSFSSANNHDQNAREELALLREVIEHTDDCIVVLERIDTGSSSLRDWRYIIANKNAIRLLGEGVAKGKTVRQSFPNADELWYDIFDEVFASGKNKRIEKEAKTISLFLEVSLTRLTSGGNRPLLMVSMKDISQLRNLDASIRSNQEIRTFSLWLTDDLRALSDDREIMARACESMGLLLNVGRCGFAELSSCGKYLDVQTCWTDGNMENALGRHQCANFGEDLISLYRLGDNVVIDDVATDERTQLSRAAFAAIGGVRACLTAPLMKQGKWVGSFFAQQTSPRRWSEREQALLREIASRSWDAVERARAEKELRQANERKDIFLATLAHELRNPLAPISAGLHLLAKNEHTPKQARVFEMMSRQTKNMTRLVDELLDVMRINRGLIVIKPEIVDIKDILQSAYETCKPEIEKNQHTFSFRMDETFMPVYGDNVRLTQVFSNIINNACKFTPKGGNISVDAKVIRTEIIIQISDTGIGLEENNFHNIFELFSQVADPGCSTGGLGIGLNLARRLVEKHNGSISAFSPGPNKGTTFTVLLPIANHSAKPVSSSQSMPNKAFAGLKILVVDDNQDAATSISMLLQAHGANTQTCYSGADALSILALREFDVLLLDLGMPGMDGYEVARRIRADNRFLNLQLIALTGWGEKKEREQTADVGFNAHLTKPAHPYSIWQAIKPKDSQAK